MKKFRYASSIGMGVLVGTIIALFVGNTTTAILCGVISAGLTTWLGSLQWSRAKKFATDVADRMDVAVLASGMKNTIPGIGKAILWLLSAMKKLAIALATNVNIRKTVLAGLVILAISFLSLFFVLTTETTPGVFLIIIFPLWLSALALAVISVIAVTIIWTSSILAPLTPEKAKQMRLYFLRHDKDSFLKNWFFQIIEDDYGSIAAIARMLYIRTGNALRILAYPLVLAGWGMTALANNKTGASALSAMILSSAHLALSHAIGDIDQANANFWLSLIVAMGLGATIGRKIYKMKESNEINSLPSIKFRDQVEIRSR